MAITSQRKENIERETKLPEEEPKTFEHLVQSLYVQEYKISDEPRAGIARMLEPVYLYMLAEEYCVLKLKNNICRLLYDVGTNQDLGVAEDAVTYAYDTPPQKSPMRRVLVD